MASEQGDRSSIDLGLSKTRGLAKRVRPHLSPPLSVRTALPRQARRRLVRQFQLRQSPERILEFKSSCLGNLAVPKVLPNVWEIA